MGLTVSWKSAIYLANWLLSLSNGKQKWKSLVLVVVSQTIKHTLMQSDSCKLIGWTVSRRFRVLHGTAGQTMCGSVTACKTFSQSLKLLETVNVVQSGWASFFKRHQAARIYTHRLKQWLSDTDWLDMFSQQSFLHHTV